MASLPLSTSSVVVVVGVLLILYPIFSAALSSTLFLVLFSPILLILVILIGFASTIVAAHLLDTRRPRRNRPLLSAARPFGFSTPAAWEAVLTRIQWSQKAPQSLPLLIPDDPVISAALNEILIMIVRDFVLVWYKDISSSPTFPVAVSAVLHQSIKRLLQRLEDTDLASLLIKRILPKITTHIDHFRESEVALRGAALERRLTQSQELDILLASRYAIKAGGRLHSAVENLSTSFTKQAEEEHLRALIERALPFILPEAEANSTAVKIVVREIAACSVLYPIMDMLGDPDFWNRTIDQIAGAAIHQQKLISRVRTVLEAQSPRANKRAAGVVGSEETITIRTDPRQFESFLRSIARYSSLLDARRLKNDIVGEIRRTRLLLANHEKDDWINGEKTEDVVAFLDRLYTAKRKVEARITELGGEEDKSHRSTYHEDSTQGRITLRDVLQNHSSLSYFMEAMDRKNRSLLVQFWLTVESFKAPLESVDSDSSGEEEDPIHPTPSSDTVVEDISMVKDLYFSSVAPHPALASIPKKYVENIKAFSPTDGSSSLASQRKARRSILLAQRHVERQMQQDFEDFQRSELWFKVTSDSEFSTRKYEANEPASGSGSEAPSRISSPPPAPSLFHRLTPPPPLLTTQRSTSDSLTGRPSSVKSLAPSLGSPSTRSQPTNLEALLFPSLAASSSRAPLFGDEEERADLASNTEKMEAIQAALTDIIASEKDGTADPIAKTDHHHRRVSSHSSSQAAAVTFSEPPGARNKRRAVFSDVFETINDNEEDQAEDHSDHPAFQTAGPGDLQLSYEIARLGDKIANLVSQEAMLDTLIRKAELTGDTQELRLLTKSKGAMNRELRELRFQKTQYEQQESANKLLSDRTKVSIVSSTVGEEEGKSVVRYLVEVQQVAPDGTFTSGWVVARRYNEFLNMHNKLRESYALVRNLDFPGKRLVNALTGNAVDIRKNGLEKYLQSLISIPAVCESIELRTFLSRDSPFIASKGPAGIKSPTAFSGTDLVRTAFKSVADSIDDIFFGPPMLDVMIQRLTRQAAEFAGIVGAAVNDEDLVARALQSSGKTGSEAALMQLSSDLKPLEGETSSSTFSAPICDLILAVFELHKQNNWLRRQAIVIILQQLLGSTIERKVRETLKSAAGTTQIMGILRTFRDSLWPGGKLRPPSVPRTAEEKLQTRDDANRKLSSLIPDLAANMIGRTNARRGARRIFAVLQNRRLNQHVAYTVVDEVFNALFPPDASAGLPKTPSLA